MTDQPSALADPPDPASAMFDELSALFVSAELSCCELAESAGILHCWLRELCPHEAIAITANRMDESLSEWTSPSFELPAGLDWSSPTVAGDLGRPLIAAGGDAGSSDVTIFVVLAESSGISCSQLEAALRALARVLTARIGGSALDADTTQLAVAHAVAGERDRLTRELTDHFAQCLHMIIGHLGDDAGSHSRPRLQAATNVASRALVDLRGGRPRVWRQGVDDAFEALQRDLGDLAGAAGIQLECSLRVRQPQSLPDVVLDAACWITRAAMLNVVEHSRAIRARIEWCVDEYELVVSVLDDGGGFELQRAAGEGLGAMRRRSEVLGGSLEIESASGWGTRVRARMRLHVDEAVLADESASAVIGTLGDRERDVLRLMAVGNRNREIASELCLSPHTVKFHVGNILEKLGVRSRSEAAAVAFQAGLQPAAAATMAAA